MTRRLRDGLARGYGRLDARLGGWAMPAWLVGGLVLLIAITTALGFGLAALPSGSQDSVDLGVTEWMVQRRTPWLNGVAWGVTHAGDTITLVILAGLVGLAWRWRRGDWAAVAVIGGAYAGALVVYRSVKQLVARARPAAELALGEAPGLSFPSGHTTGSTAVYVALALLVVVMLHNPTRPVVMGALAALVVAIGLSRVYLGVHWMGDVLAGWLAGAAWAHVVMAPAWARRRQRSVDRPPGAEPGRRPSAAGDDQAFANS